VARREKTQLPIVVFCIFTAVILRWCDKKDLVLRFLISGRHHPKLENMIGFLAEFLHLRIEVTAETSLLDLLRQGDLEFHSAYEHHDFGRVPEFIPEWAWDMDVIDLRFQWAPSSTATWPSESGASDRLSMQPMSLSAAKPFDFFPIFYDSPNGIGCSVIYRPDVFAPSTMERFGRHLLAVGTDLVEQPSVRVDSILLR
jgi:non-ribosomal peptide synthetase component F